MSVLTLLAPGHPTRFQTPHRWAAFLALPSSRLCSRRLRFVAAAPLCALVTVLLFWTAPASAALTHPFLNSLGPSGVGAGAFERVRSIAVDSATGDVYVLDTGKQAIYKFNAAGAPVNFSGLGTNVIEGVTSSGGGAEFQIAVDSSNGPDKGDIYVANNEVVLIYGEDGKPVEVGGEPAKLTGGEACGVAVDPSGVVYVGFYPETVRKYTPVSNPVTNADETASMAGLKSICNIAVDGEGNVFAATYSGGVSEYSSLQFGSLAATGTVIDEEKGSTLAGDPAIPGHVYIDEGSDIAEYETSGTPTRLGTTGTSEPGQLSESFGVAVAGASGSETLYGSSAAREGVIDRYGPAALVPEVVVAEVTNLKTTSVTLNGTVNPSSNTIEAEYQFQYGTTTAYGTSSPATPAKVGTGEAPVPMIANLTGLEPNTTYHYRLNGINANGTEHTADHTFTTPGPPRIEGEGAEAVTQSGATLASRLSADGFKTSYHFEYGETIGYGTSTSSGELEPSEEHPVTAAVTGLKVGTTYHYRLVASSEVEGKLETVDGPDEEFTTIAAAPISSESVSNLSPTSVQLDAKVNPLGNDTHAYFQYGTENCTEHPASCANIPAPPGTDLGAGTGDQETTIELTGLTPETTYHYRVIATNTLGTASGPDETFTTYPAAPGSGGCPNEQLRAETHSSRLPDCRVYELVSPPNKHGNQAGVNGSGNPLRAAASPSGNRVAYEGTGPLVESPTGQEPWSVSLRSSTGWTTRAALPRIQEQVLPALGGPVHINPAPDLSSFYFSSIDAFVGPPDLFADPNIFVAGENAFLEPEWISRPTIANPEPPLNSVADATNSELAGGSQDLSTVYFTYAGTLVREDEPRANNPAFQAQIAEYLPSPNSTDRIWGLYESKGHGLKSAGILPDGSTDPWGAVPAATEPGGLEPDAYNNQVAADGSRAFFVSPDPAVDRTGPGAGDEPCPKSGYEAEHPGGCIPQLYVRVNGEKTELVSADALASKPGEPPAPAPHGPLPVPAPVGAAAEPAPYVFASPDGSHAFFESHDKLAKSATAQEPTGAGPWTYDFEVNTGSLTYLPGVVGPVIASSADGSRFVFENTSTAPPTLQLWSAASPIATIAPLPKPESVENAEGEGNRGTLRIAPTRVTADGSVVAFETDSPLPGGFNNRGGWTQVYRYEATTGKLNCVSCPPHGVTPSGDAHLSEDDGQPGRDGATERNSWVSNRGISADGSRVFFDTRDPLVAQDTNNHRDVYEWENGKVALISSGTSLEDAFFMDNSESGEDVFFSTSQGLARVDTDGAYDVYDARMGVPAAPSPPACSGTGCQGLPSPPPGFSTPSSATFAGTGNYPPSPPAGKPKALTRAQLLARALHACHSKRNHKKRAACERAAQKKYSTKAKGTSRRTRR